MKNAILLLSLLLLAACTVEPRPFPEDATIVVDAGFADATNPDATLSCRFGEIVCGDGKYCADSDTCEDRPTDCARTSLCAPGDICTFVGTATVGSCGDVSCDSHSDCLAGHCTAVGVCSMAAGAYEAGVEALPVAVCQTADACGPSLVCMGQLCSGCVTAAECGRNLRCSNGVCGEHSSCLDDQQCFSENSCGDNNTCERATDQCTPDQDNDSLDTPTVLVDGRYEGFSICGDDIDWYALGTEENDGALVILTYTATAATLSANVFDVNGVPISELGYLQMPGLTVMSIPVSSEERDLRIGVASLERSVGYVLDVRAVAGNCTRDALDLFGDAELDRAQLIDTNSPLSQIACPEDVDIFEVQVEADDILSVNASFAGSGTNLDLEILDEAGNLLASSVSTDTSTETVNLERVTAAQTLSVRVTAKQAPTAGQRYTLSIDRILGTRYRACQSPPVIQTGTTAGFLISAENLGRPSCADYAAFEQNDLLYRIEPTGQSLLSARVVQTSGLPATLSIALLEDCEAETTFACQSAPVIGRAIELEQVLSSTNAVYLMVSSDVDDVIIEIELLLEPLSTPSNNECIGAVDLAQSGRQAVVTYAASNTVQLQASNRCGIAGEAAGPDRFYQASLAGGERAAFELSGPSGGFLWISTDCGQMTNTCTTSAEITASAPARVSVSPTMARTFFLAVDGIGSESKGVYELRTIRGSDLLCLNDGECAPNRCDEYQCVPVPSNDYCNSPELLTLINDYVTVAASTGPANDSFDLTCQIGSRDVVYQVTLASNHQSLTARIAEANFDPILAIRPQCSSSVNEACNDDISYPDILLPEVTFPNPTAGDYFIVVDGYDGSGSFVLEVVATP